MHKTDPDRLLTHLRVLTDDIGIRLAGTEGEARAQAYIADHFRATGAKVTEEAFPVRSRVVEQELLEVRVGGKWRRFTTSLFSNTPGTNGELREAPLVIFEAPTEYARADLSHLRGKAVVHLGCHIESREHYRRLIEAEPAFILMVDVRYPGTVALADGMFPAYTSDIGAVPTLNVAYWDAWQWMECGADAARVQVQGGMQEAMSANVIAELPGTSESEVLYVGGHHDTQAGSVGADDNGTGVVGLLELARVLAPLPRRRTIRLICFGAEEQLSVGSAAYVRRHRDDVTNRGALIWNLDGYGSRLGWTTLTCNGPDELESEILRVFTSHDEYARIIREIVPYADHFPFVAAGVPGVFVHRPNCAGGRFFHHRADDDISRLDAPRMASILDASADLLMQLANADVLPFRAEIPAAQREKVAGCWADLFGGW